MRKKATVVASQQLSPSVRALSLQVEGGLAFDAGQWLNTFLPGPTGELRRAYSIASAPGDPLVELAITAVANGLASPRLHALLPGDTLDIDGPHGFFTRPAELSHAPALFVATGTGLAPIRSMLRALANARAETPPLTLLFGCRTPADALYIDELNGLRQHLPHLRIEISLSRPDAGYRGRTGYVQGHVAELARALDQPHIFACGLGHMVNAVRTLCKNELALDRRHIHTERFDV